MTLKVERQMIAREVYQCRKDFYYI